MFADTSGSVRKAFLVGASLMVALPAVAQQVANVNAPTDRAAYLAAACDHVRDPNLRVGCRGEATIRFDEARTIAAKQTTAVANQSTATAQELQRCIAYLGEKRSSGAVFDRTITRENVCPYARELGMN